MQQSATTASSTNASGFASLLSALVAPTPKPAPKADTGWNDDDLADDIAALSYECALSKHAHYRASESELENRSLTQTSNPEPLSVRETLSANHSSPAQASSQVVSSCKTNSGIAGISPASETASNRANPSERNLKSASVTIRMSKAECDQLRERAAEAGLTISAYLRACTFDAESLRAQVKETLAQLRSAAAPQSAATVLAEKQTSISADKRAPKAKRPWFGWLRPRRLFPQSHSSPRAARA